MKHFLWEEFECPCCGENDFCPETALKLDATRESAATPFVINSACRCEERNEKVGGKPTSSHLLRDDRPVTAVDISTPDSHTRFLVMRALIERGWHRIGVGRNFIHADEDTSKPGRLIWTYYAS